MLKIFLSALFSATLVAGYTQCKCANTPTENRWGQVDLQLNRTGPVRKVSCGFQLSATCRDTVWVRGGAYSCVGTCTATYRARLTRGSTLVRTYEPFNFTTSFISFPTAGSYKLEILPMCNNELCKTCSFFFTVSGAGCL
jgi:hypothetical protein